MVIATLVSKRGCETYFVAGKSIRLAEAEDKGSLWLLLQKKKKTEM